MASSKIYSCRIREHDSKFRGSSPHELNRGNVDSHQEAKTTAQVRICLGRSTCGGDDTGDPFHTPS